MEDVNDTKALHGASLYLLAQDDRLPTEAIPHSGPWPPAPTQTAQASCPGSAGLGPPDFSLQEHCWEVTTTDM